MVELKRGKTTFTVSLTIWTLSLELARLSGWTPAGTGRADAATGQKDTHGDMRHLVCWQTEYQSSDGQTVSDGDARQLASALKKAAREGSRILNDFSTQNPPPDIRTDRPGFHWFLSQQGKLHLQQLADFCQAGAFQIF